MTPMITIREKIISQLNNAMVEKTFKRFLTTYIRKLGDVQLIENLYDRGVPDVNICVQGVEIWIETKYAKHNKIDFSPEQRAWHIRRKINGGQAFVICYHENKNEISFNEFILQGDCPMYELFRCKKDDFHETFHELLKHAVNLWITKLKTFC